MRFYYPMQVLLSILGIIFPVPLPADVIDPDFQSMVDSRQDAEIAELSRKIDALKLAIRCPCPRGGECICPAGECLCPNCPKHSKAKTATNGRTAIVAGASWCGPCKEGEAERKAAGLVSGKDYEHFDVDQNPALKAKYGVGDLPALILLENGKVVTHHTGLTGMTRKLGEWIGKPLPAGVGANLVGGKPSSPAATSLPPDAQPTPWNEVQEGLKLLNPKPSEVLADFGCGHDARLLIHAARYHDVKKSVGVEIDKQRADSAKRYVNAAGLDNRINILEGDATKTEVGANIGLAYLWPDTLRELRPAIEKLDRFASYMHAVPGLKMTKRGNWYLWEKKAPVEFSSVAWKPQRSQPVYQPVYYSKPSISQPVYYNTPSRSQPVYYNSGASWGGRSYSAPVCNSPYCSMCNSIRQQLSYR